MHCYVTRTRHSVTLCVHCLPCWMFSCCDMKQPHCSSFCTVCYRTTEQAGITVRFPSIPHSLIFGGYSDQGVKLNCPSSAAFMPTKIRTDFYVMTPCSLVGGYCRVQTASNFRVASLHPWNWKHIFPSKCCYLYTVYSVQYTVYSLQYKVYSIQYRIYSVQYKVYSIQYTV